jgi:hypothetical protein
MMDPKEPKPDDPPPMPQEPKPVPMSFGVDDSREPFSKRIR